MRTTAVLVQECGELLTSTPLFRVSLAQTMEDVRECQRLRYEVFNVELGEGLRASRNCGLDHDSFDVVCDHLMVQDSATGKLAGTYRLQTGYRAKGNLGYYGEQLFDFRPFEAIRGEILELGRACVHQEYRNSTALYMLWKGLRCTRCVVVRDTSSAAAPSLRRMRTKEWPSTQRCETNISLKHP